MMPIISEDLWARNKTERMMKMPSRTIKMPKTMRLMREPMVCVCVCVCVCEVRRAIYNLPLQQLAVTAWWSVLSFQAVDLAKMFDMELEDVTGACWIGAEADCDGASVNAEGKDEAQRGW
jgi:hypothetical protein